MNDENLWGDDEGFVDMPDEAKLDANGRPMQAPPVHFPRPKQATSTPKPPIVVEEVEELVEELQEQEEDYTDVLTDAHLRLEQGSLYKMIMNHPLFEGMDADPRAVQNVQNEIRNFAKERMEIMLGMRKETSTVERLEIDFPFNSLEVEALKALARAVTKGATDNSDRYVPEVTRSTEELDNVPKRKALNPIGGSTAPRKATAAAVKKPLQKTPVAPIKRSKRDLLIDQIAAEEGVPRELLEIDTPGVGGKPLHEMTPDEILERNKLIGKRRGTQAKSDRALPMPTYEQQNAHAAQRASNFGSTPMGQKILDAVKSMPIKQS